MRLEKRYAYPLAVLALGSFAGAVHAQEGWLRTQAVAAFPDIEPGQPASISANAPSSEISEGADLNRELRLRRSVHNTTAKLRELLPNPYGTSDNPEPATRSAQDFDVRAQATYTDAGWSNPYAVVRRTDGEGWSNPYVTVRDTRLDERWSNPYAVVRKTDGEGWSNPYAASVR